MKISHFIPSFALLMIFLIISMPFCFAQEMSLSYDANGNLVTGDGKYRTYNSLNQLYRVYNGSNSSGTLLYEFKYHPIEERVLVKKSYNNSGALVETVYYWSQNFITVVNASGSYNFTYVYHNGDLVAQQNPDGSKLFVMGDNKGSTSVVMNSSGSVLERTTYSPFGEVLSGGRLSRYGYEGKEQQPAYGSVPTAGLVSYYSLESTALDDTGRNNGLVANASITTGKVKGGYLFDGSADYVKVNDSGSLDLTANMTISVWLNPRSSTQGYVVCKYGAYMIQFQSSNNSQGGIWVGGNWTSLVSTTTSLNTWTHVVFTYNGTMAVIYKNGVQTGSASSTSLADINTKDLYIGAKNSTDRTRDFNGSIDEVGIWNRALSATEVKQLYDYGATRDSIMREIDFNARSYNAEIQIFGQADTEISNLFDSQKLNRFMFERGNPYKYTDPTGHIELSIFRFPLGDIFKFPTPFENVASPGTVNLPSIFDPMNVYVPNPVNEQKYSDFVNQAREYSKMAEEMTRAKQELSPQDFWGGPAKKAGFKPKKDNGGRIQIDKEGRAIDEDGAKWKWDRKSGHFHKFLSDRYGDYQNVNPDGSITHQGQSNIDPALLLEAFIESIGSIWGVPREGGGRDISGIGQSKIVTI